MEEIQNHMSKKTRVGEKAVYNTNLPKYTKKWRKLSNDNAGCLIAKANIH